MCVLHEYLLRRFITIDWRQ